MDVSWGIGMDARLTVQLREYVMIRVWLVERLVLHTWLRLGRGLRFLGRGRHYDYVGISGNDSPNL